MLLYCFAELTHAKQLDDIPGSDVITHISLSPVSGEWLRPMIQISFTVHLITHRSWTLIQPVMAEKPGPVVKRERLQAGDDHPNHPHAGPKRFIS
jgi:hypothetical protein